MKSLLTLCGLLIFAPLVWAAPQLPAAPSGYVLDEAQILSSETEAQLEQKLATLEKETSTEMVVVTVASLQGYPIESFALELGRAWGVGQEDFNNGLVFLIAPTEREVRIEVGYGLEGVITDAQSSAILNNVVSPQFKAGQYDQGTLETVAYLDQMARGEEFNIPSYVEESFEGGFWVFLLYFLPFLWAILSWFSHSKAWWLGGLFGGVLGFIGTVSLLGLAIGAVGGLFLDYILSTYLYQKVRLPKGGRGGFWGGHGGGFGGGGFGGGSFGGGGASGRF